MLPQKLIDLGFTLENGVLKGDSNAGCTISGRGNVMTITTPDNEKFEVKGVTELDIGTMEVSGAGKVGITLH